MTGWENILAISKSDKKQIFRLYGELLKSNKNKTATQIE